MKRQHREIATNFTSPMFQLTQFIQNTFIRIFGILAQLFGFVGQFFRQLGGITSRIFGLTREGGYFLDSNDAQTIKRIEDRSTVATGTVSSQQSSTESSNSSPGKRSSRRRPGKEINHFRDMAKQIRNS